MNWTYCIGPGRLAGMTLLSGLYVPMITPFDRSGAVAVTALRDLAHRMLEAGAAGLVALGTTAEPDSLNEREQRDVLDTIAEVCAERGGQLIVGAHTVAALGALRDRRGVTAALTLVPPFVRPGEAGVLAHLTHLAEASPIPVVVYDVPLRTGQYLKPEILRRLAEVPGIVGVKYSVGGINADTIDLLADPPTDLAILGGEDVFVSPLLGLGAHGGILASAHLATERFAGLVNDWRSGDYVQARRRGARLSRLSHALFAEPNPTVIKAVLHDRGLIPTESVRLPLLAAQPESTELALRRLDEVSAGGA